MSQGQGLPGPENAGRMSINELHETSMNIVENVVSIVTLPVEIFLRPQFGTRYFAPPTFFLSAIMLILAAAFLGLITSVGQMIPFGHFQGPSGLFSMGSFTKLFFNASFVHGIRTWRRMINMFSEKCSTYEGPALFFFRFLPKGSSFWFCRIVWEPGFLIAVAIVLSRLFIIQQALALYLEIAGLCLAMKNYIAWFRCWSYIRTLMDMQAMGPLLAKIVENTATEDELAQVHLAALPKDLPDDVRRDTIAHVASAFVPSAKNA